MELQDSLLRGSPLECPICLERMQDVSFLTTEPDSQGNVCNHWFCSQCIEDIVDNERSKGKTAYCPSCRRAIISIHNNRFANEILREVSMERESKKRINSDWAFRMDEMKKNHEKEIAELNKKSQELGESQRKTQLESFKVLLNEEKRKAQEEHKKNLQYIEEDRKKNMEELEKKRREFEEERIGYKEKESSLLKKIAELEAQKRFSLDNFAKEREEFEKKWNLKNIQLKNQEENTSQLTLQINNLKIEKSKLRDELEKYKGGKDRIIQEKTEEAARWQKMYHKLANEREQDKMITVLEPKKNVDNGGSSYLGSWMNTKSALSYLGWSGGKIGPLVRDSTQFRILEKRGSSHQSAVWKANWTVKKHGLTTKSVVAIKKLKLGSGSNSTIENRFRESMILSKFEHKNILKVEGLLRDFQEPNDTTKSDFMVLPFYEYDLEYLMGEHRLDSTTIRFIIYQVLSAFTYFHSAMVIHRDIKPTSILLDGLPGQVEKVAIGSFSSARSILNSRSISHFPFSRYSPPESCFANAASEGHSAQYWKGGDMWSLGIIFAEMLLGSPLVDGRDKNSLLYSIFSIRDCRPSTEEIARFPALNSIYFPQETISLSAIFAQKAPSVSQNAVDLLRKMITFNPENRIRPDEAMAHPYFNGVPFWEVYRTCPLGNELADSEVLEFVKEQIGGE